MLLGQSACAQDAAVVANGNGPSTKASVTPTPTSTATPGPGASTRPGASPTPTAALPGIASFCPSGPFPSPLPQNPAVQVLNGSGPHFDHFDGPVWVPALGKLFFSAWNNTPDNGNGPESAIYALTPPSTFEVVSPAGRFGTNGLALDAQGCIVAAAHDREEVSRFCHGDPNTRTTLASMYNGLHFNSPNDAAVRADGHIYFTDPDYQRDNRQGQPQTRVYHIAPNGTVTVVDASRDEPNGIALSLDENTLLVGGNDGIVARYPIATDGSGSTGAAQNWITLGNNGDGMVLDCAGNLYVAIYAENRIGVWNAAGASVGSIPVGDNITNLAFGGADRMTLYITTVSQVASVRLLVPGLPH